MLSQGVLEEKDRLISVLTTALPEVSILVDDYHKRRDGSVEIHGYSYRVTHPITRYGWESRGGIAKLNENI